MIPRKQALALELQTPIEEFTPSPSGIVPKVAPIHDPLAELLGVLDPVHVSSVLLGREEGPPPRCFARSTHVQTAITEEELEALAARGATLQGDTQRIEIPPSPSGVTYSVRCADCRRWIACIAREGACVCGQTFTVRIDEFVANAIPEGHRCMNCGAREAPGPWRRMSDAQSICDVCNEMPHTGAWRLADE
jgi:hypothetical protein